jgi:DNA-binding transcriptional LysR family regulator
MDRLETRELRYFIAVAETLHFGRAAERLGIAQPPLSRAIRQLEHRIGAELFDRGGRQVRLTPAGEVLLHEGRKALEAVSAALLRTRRAAAPAPNLVLASKAGCNSDLLTAILNRFAAEQGAILVEPLICRTGEQAELLRNGTADLALLHGPWDDTSGFDTELLAVERQVAVMAKNHRLAGRSALLMADLAGEKLPRWPGQPDDGLDGPEIQEASQLTYLAALGRVVAILPESAREHARRDLAYVPVLDAPTSTVLLAWPERSRSLAVAAFVQVATEVARPVAEVSLGSLSG